MEFGVIPKRGSSPQFRKLVIRICTRGRRIRFRIHARKIYTCAKRECSVREKEVGKKKRKGGATRSMIEREGDIGRPTGSGKDGEIIEEHVSMEFSLEFLGVSNTSIKSFIIHSMNKYTKSWN